MISALWSKRQSRRLIHVLCLTLLAGMMVSRAVAQEPEDDKEKEKDDPRARQKYIEEMRGSETGIPPGARLKALKEMDEMIRQEGERYRLGRSLSQSASSFNFSATGSAAQILTDPMISEGSPTSSQWLFIGPKPTIAFINSSGRTTAMVVDPADATGNTVYIGGAQGGVWKTTDGGTNWTPLTDAQPSLATGSMAIDGTTSPSTVYVGTGEQGFSFDGYYGAGVLRSIDGGTSWTQLGASIFAGPLSGCGSSGTGCGGAFIGGLSVRPGVGQPATLLAAVSLPFGTSGVYRTLDGGTSWTRIPTVNVTTSLGATSVAYATNLVAYAGADGLGMFKSTDGGSTFAPANGLTWVAGTGAGGATDITTTSTGRVEFAVAASDVTGATVYASVGFPGGTLAGFYKTTDGGDHWTKLGPAGPLPGLPDYCTAQCWYDNVVAVNPTNANIVFVGGAAVTGHISKSTDGGTTWAAATSSIHVDHHAAAFTANGAKLYWGNDGGVYSTTNTGVGAVTWTNLNGNLGLTQFYSYFALHPTNINITFAGAQDNSTQKYDGTQSVSSAWTNVTCGDGAGAVIDFNNPSLVYANCQNIDIRKSSSGGGSGSFSQSIGGINTSDSVSFIPPLIGDANPAALNRLYFGTCRVWMSSDGAVSWTAISGDVTTLGCPTGSGAINNMALAPSDPSVIYVGTRNGLVSKGTAITTSPSFVDVTGTGLPASRRVNALAVSSTDPNTVFAGMSGFGTTNQHIFKSIAGGGTWTNISNNLPNTPVNDIVVDPDIANTLYVATDIGVFRSQDGGASWSTLANGLPRIAVYGLKLHRVTRTLRAVTHGRGVWDLSVPASVVGAGALFSPGSLSFSSQPVGIPSTSQPITFSNNGTATTNISSVSISVNGAEFSQTNNCPASLAPAGSCIINVTFTPNATGNRTGTLTVASNAASSPTNASLSGLAGPPNDNFANATVVNSGNYTNNISTVGATTEGTDPLSLCDSQSPPNKLKTVWYSYTPASSGNADINTIGSDYDTILAIFTGTQGSLVEQNCNDDLPSQTGAPSQVNPFPVTGGTTYKIMAWGFPGSDSGNLTFHVVGPAPAANPPALGLSTSLLTFTNQTVNTTSGLQTVTLTANNGTVSSILVSTATGDFTRTNNCGASLTQNSTCTVTVTFTPTTTGTRNGSFTITSNGTGSPQTVNLTGTGVDVLTLAPSTLTFSAVPGRSTAPQNVVFTNTTGGSVTVTSVVASATYSQVNNCGVVANNGSCTANVTFSPVGGGASNGTLTVNTSGGNRSATLNGTGVTFNLSLVRPTRPSRTNGATIVIDPGQSANFDVQLGVDGTADEMVSLECVGAPRGATCSVEPAMVRLDQPLSNIRVVVLTSAGNGRAARLGGVDATPAGTYSIRVNARMGNVVRSVDLPLQVKAGQARSGPRRLQR